MNKKNVRTLKASAWAGVAVAMASLLPSPALAAETETVGGITWTFRYRTEGAEIKAGVVIVPSRSRALRSTAWATDRPS